MRVWIVILGLASTLWGCAAKGKREAVSTAPVVAYDHIGLTTESLEKSQRFFESVLGFSKFRDNSDYPSAFLKKGPMRLTLWEVKDLQRVNQFDRKLNVGLHHLAIGVASLDDLFALFDKVKAYPGVVVEFAPENLGEGPSQHCIFYEPGGSRIELIHRVN